MVVKLDRHNLSRLRRSTTGDGAWVRAGARHCAVLVVCAGYHSWSSRLANYTPTLPSPLSFFSFALHLQIRVCLKRFVREYPCRSLPRRLFSQFLEFGDFRM